MPARSGSSAPARRQSMALSERDLILLPSQTQPQGFALEFFVAAADFAQSFESAAAEFAPRPRQGVRYMGDPRFHLPQLACHKKCFRRQRGRIPQRDERFFPVRSLRNAFANPRRPARRGRAPILSRKILRVIRARESQRGPFWRGPILLRLLRNPARRAQRSHRV